jgi:hypothetical protein
MKRTKNFFLLAFSLTFLFGCSSNPSDNKRTGAPIDKGTASAKEVPKGITVNKIKFEVVNYDKLPPNMINSINILKANRGYIVSEDNGYYYITIFSGRKNTGGYTIKVLSVEDNEGRTNIEAEEKGPGSQDIVTQVITYPYTTIKVTGIAPNFNIRNTQGETFERIMKQGEVH